MKRVGRVVTVLATAAVTAAFAGSCMGPPGLPSGYQRPVIDSIIGPGPAAPGSAVSWTVEAHDDQAVSAMFVTRLRGGDRTVFPDPTPCGTSLADQGGDVTHGTFTVTCDVPTFANNGTWELTLNLSDRPLNGENRDYPGTTFYLTFTVVGGSDDTSGPHFDSHSFSLPQLYRDSVFTLTATFADPSGVQLGDYNGLMSLSKMFGPNTSLFSCGDAQRVALPGSQYEFSWDCHGTATTESGSYQLNVDTIDGLGHKTHTYVSGIEVGPSQS